MVVNSFLSTGSGINPKIMSSNHIRGKSRCTESSCIYVGLYPEVKKSTGEGSYHILYAPSPFLDYICADHCTCAIACSPYFMYHRGSVISTGLLVHTLVQLKSLERMQHFLICLCQAHFYICRSILPGICHCWVDMQGQTRMRNLPDTSTHN